MLCNIQTNQLQYQDKIDGYPVIQGLHHITKSLIYNGLDR